MYNTFKDQTLITMSRYVSNASNVLPRITLPMLGLLAVAAMVRVAWDQAA